MKSSIDMLEAYLKSVEGHLLTLPSFKLNGLDDFDRALGIEANLIREHCQASERLRQMSKPGDEDADAARRAIEAKHEARDTALQLCASLSTCDTMGDVAGDVSTALMKLGYSKEGREDLYDRRGILRREWFGDRGITTLSGTSLGED